MQSAGPTTKRQKIQLDRLERHLAPQRTEQTQPAPAVQASPIIVETCKLISGLAQTGRQTKRQAEYTVISAMYSQVFAVLMVHSSCRGERAATHIKPH